jgi:hypothetical protein
MSSLVFVRLTSHQEKLLGKTALSLYRVLRRLRGKASVTKGFTKSLAWLCFETNLETRTAKRGLKRLRECGAIRTRKLANNSLEFFVRGKVRRGAVWLPETIETWCLGRRTQGRQRAKDVPSSEQNGSEKSKDAEGLQIKDVPSYIHNHRYVSDTSFSFGERKGLRPDSEVSFRKLRTMTKWPKFIQRALDRGSITLFEAELLLPRTDDPEPPKLTWPFTFDEVNASMGAGIERLIQYRRDNPRPSRIGPPPELPPLCPVRKVKLGYEEIEAGTSAKVMVTLMLQGYEEASHAVYGTGRYAIRMKGVRNLETHARLLKAARWLQDHGIAPGAWAHWQLAYCKKKGDTPWGPARIFVLSRMEKMEDFFFQDYDGPQGVREEWTDEHREQLYRRQEAMARWENKTLNPLLNIGMPWYREMRKAEIARGMVDPLDGYMKV